MFGDREQRTANLGVDASGLECVTKSNCLMDCVMELNVNEPGIEKENIEMFNENLSRNLYKIWNRMSLGSYFPPAVSTVSIPTERNCILTE